MCIWCKEMKGRLVMPASKPLRALVGLGCSMRWIEFHWWGRPHEAKAAVLVKTKARFTGLWFFR
jgi:hypothetical protein